MSKIKSFLNAIFSQKPVNFFGLIIALIALLVSINALNVTWRMYILTSKDYLPELQFETSDQSIKVIDKTNDIFKIDRTIQFMTIEEVSFAQLDTSGTYIVTLPLVRNSRTVHSQHISNGHSEEFYFNTNVYPGWGLSNPNDPNSGYVFYIPWDWSISPIGNDLYTNIQRKIESEISHTTNFYYLVKTRYADKFHNIKSIYYKCSFPSNITEFFGAEMINEEEFNKILSGCITSSALPETEDFDKLWNYLIQTHRKKF